MPTLLITLVVIISVMVLMWGLSLLLRDASIVDPFWGMGFVIVAWVTVAVNWPWTPRLLLVCILVTLWGLRLSGYLLWRNFGKEEDARYTAMREKHGDRFWWVSLFTVFLLQGILLWFISFPVQWVAIAGGGSAIYWLDALGVGIWSIGFFFESVGDWQLAHFRSNPDNADKVLNTGLWRYTRHPNYFGNFCIWWGIYLVSVSGGGAGTILSPLLMSVLLLKVSGVALLEKDIASRRPEYEAYKKTTSSFFPWPIKNTN